MHAYQRFVRTEMDKRGWTAADLSRASGLSRQHLSRILGDDRDVLQRRPESSTIEALATAFGVSADYVLSFVAEAMGFPSGRVAAPDPSALSDDELLRLLGERLRRAREYERDNPRSAGPSDGGADDLPVAGDAEPDGVTPSDPDRPWLHDEFALAAKRGVNRGKEARRQQDREAEAGGA